jgi:hypothetical protein
MGKTSSTFVFVSDLGSCSILMTSVITIFSTEVFLGRNVLNTPKPIKIRIKGIEENKIPHQ